MCYNKLIIICVLLDARRQQRIYIMYHICCNDSKQFYCTNSDIRYAII